jgi:hypothetical protein
MKKLITIFLCTTYISANAIAQSGVRIGNMEIILRKTENDTVAQITIGDPCPPCPSEKETRPKEKSYNRNVNIADGFCGIGFILPNYSNGYYPTLSPGSINIDIGGSRRFQLTRWFALGGTMQYSFYNYKLNDVVSEPAFVTEVTKGESFESKNLRKQVFRSHNIAVGPFMRINLVQSSRPKKSDGFYIDLGVQGDFAFSKYYKHKTTSGGKLKLRNGDTLNRDVFNPFTASAIARIGWSEKAIFVRYRFTEVFNPHRLPMDLPPITIGIQFF